MGRHGVCRCQILLSSAQGSRSQLQAGSKTATSSWYSALLCLKLDFAASLARATEDVADKIDESEPPIPYLQLLDGRAVRRRTLLPERFQEPGRCSMWKSRAGVSATDANPWMSGSLPVAVSRPPGPRYRGPGR